MTASGAHPPEIPSVAGNTEADDTLPSIVGRGGANCQITPGPHTQLFGGARHAPPPPARGTALPAPPPPGVPPRTPLQAPPPPKGPGQQLVGGGGSWRPKPRGRPPPPPPCHGPSSVTVLFLVFLRVTQVGTWMAGGMQSIPRKDSQNRPGHADCRPVCPVLTSVDAVDAVLFSGTELSRSLRRTRCGGIGEGEGAS